MFSVLNPYANGLEVLQANSAEELLKVIKQIPLEVSIVSIYSTGQKHFAWIVTSAKIEKVKAPVVAKKKTEGVKTA